MPNPNLAGSVSIDDAGAVTGSGLALSIYNEHIAGETLVNEGSPPAGFTSTAAIAINVLTKRYYARLATAYAKGIAPKMAPRLAFRYRWQSSGVVYNLQGDGPVFHEDGDETFQRWRVNFVITQVRVFGLSASNDVQWYLADVDQFVVNHDYDTEWVIVQVW